MRPFYKNYHNSLVGLYGLRVASRVSVEDVRNPIHGAKE